MEMNSQNEREILHQLIQEDDVCVVCQEAPDGDALGSLLALTGVLRQMGKRAVAVCADPVPYVYQVLPDVDIIQHPNSLPARHLITVDCADQERVACPDEWLTQADWIININHHGSNQGFGTYNWIDAGSAATGELIYLLGKQLNIAFTPQIAQNLLAAISTDTGHFSQINTTARSFAIAAELVKEGAQVAQLCNDIYKRKRLSKTRLIGRGLNQMQVFCQGQAALITLSKQDFLDCGAMESETEGIIDYARDIDTVRVAALLRDTEQGTVKVSLRSQGDIDVSQVAMKAGGGGHRGAAGFTLHMPLEEAVAYLKDALEETIACS